MKHPSCRAVLTRPLRTTIMAMALYIVASSFDLVLRRPQAYEFVTPSAPTAQIGEDH